ncbi:hypothetical protein TSAR_014410 [Trichomalopsis sarcophagae]|uniref:Integrase catalytic domain-containing protein n=1 Tax=Trichomalopsis sarcophagae TaxID=543379 RepID=A0A232EFH9_9HYME|nr:hypothetical protein TSAR_014410 [Trichomalopsis sarcophagae]
MYRDVSNFVCACAVCQQCKVEQLLPARLMGKRNIHGPWEVVASDIMGPFPRSTKGYCYVLIFMDSFTRWIEVVPIRKADEHYTIPSYHAQANLVEQVNRTFKTLVTSFIENEHKNWDKFIPLKSLRALALPSSIWNDIQLRRTILNGQKTSRSGSSRTACAEQVEFKIIDLVWKRNRILSSAVQGINAKLAPKYAEPFKITARLGQDVYRLEERAGEVFEKIHVVDLKRYLDGEEPPTEKDLQEETTIENAQSNDHVVNVDAPRKRSRP